MQVDFAQIYSFRHVVNVFVLEPRSNDGVLSVSLYISNQTIHFSYIMTENNVLSYLSAEMSTLHLCFSKEEKTVKTTYNNLFFSTYLCTLKRTLNK